MKFILDESITLEEAGNYKYTKSTNIKTLANANQNQLNKRDRKRVADYNAGKNKENQQLGDVDPNFFRDLESLLKSRGYSQNEINDTMELVKNDETQRQQYSEIIKKEKGQSSQAQPTNDEVQADNKNEEPIDNNTEKAEQQNDETEDTTAEVGDATQKELMKVMRKSNANGFKAFLDGIKGNINNPNFPFTQLMRKKKFSKAMSIVESLQEASFIKKASDAATNVVNKLGTKLNRVNPETFRRFAAVYNAFLENDRLIRKCNYVNDSNAIVYYPNLYKLSYKDIEDAIDIDLSAIEAGNDEHRQKLKRMVDNNQLSKIGSLKGNEKEDNSFEGTLNRIKNSSPEQKKEFIQKISKAIGV